MIFLYIKLHSVTGLKYFGKTIKNPYKYNGSGKYWIKHIRKHGTQFIKTTKVWEFKDEVTCSKFALDFSKEHNIDISEDWANLILEDGFNQPPSRKNKKCSENHIEKSRLKRTGMKRSNKFKEYMSSIKIGNKTGPCSNSRKQNISKARKGKKWFYNPETLENICCLPENKPINYIPGLIKKISHF